jgi:hypothetical protein
VGDAVEKVHGPVYGIDDPLRVARLIAGDALLAVDGVAGKGREDEPLDQLLALNVERELDVVPVEGVDAQLGLEVRAEQNPAYRAARQASSSSGDIGVGWPGLAARPINARGRIPRTGRDPS